MSPEAGQILFGGYGSHEMSEIGEAAVMALIEEIHRVYWNVNQRKWDHHWSGIDPEIPGITWNGYRYPDELPEDEDTDDTGLRVALAVQGFEEFGIRWYKYPGRGMTTQNRPSPDDWSAWLERGLHFVRTHERRDNAVWEEEGLRERLGMEDNDDDGSDVTAPASASEDRATSPRPPDAEQRTVPR